MKRSHSGARQIKGLTCTCKPFFDSGGNRLCIPPLRPTARFCAVPYGKLSIISSHQPRFAPGHLKKSPLWTWRCGRSRNRLICTVYLFHCPGKGAQTEIRQHMHRLLVFLSQIFDHETNSMTVAVDRAQYQIRPLYAVFQCSAAGFQC